MKSFRRSVILKGIKMNTTFSFELQIYSLSSKIIANDDNMKKNRELLTKENIFPLIEHILQKPNRSSNEILILQTYLKIIPNFLKILNIRDDNLLTLFLKSLSVQLTLEKIQKNTILYQTGDLGNKFYIVLSGEFSILAPKEVNIRLSLNEYICHLLRLLIINEHELFNRILVLNSQIYRVDKNEIKKFLDTYNVSLENPDKNYHYQISDLDDTDIKHVLEYIKQLYYEVTQKISYRLNKTYINKEDYLNLCFPYENVAEINDNNFGLDLITLIQYHEVLKKKQGENFGEVAFIQQDKKKFKREGSVLCNENSVCAILTTKGYNTSLKEIHMLKRRADIKFMMRFQIFRGIRWETFENHFFNFCKEQVFSKNDLIIEQNKPIEYIIFVKEGEFGLFTYMNNNEIDDLIEYLSKKKKKNLYINFDEEKKEEQNTKKQIFNVCILKDNDIIGLNDILQKDKITSNFSIRCLNTTGKVLIIEKYLFLESAYKLEEMRKNVIEYTKMRKKVMIERLKTIRHSNDNNFLEIEKKKNNQFLNLNLDYSKNENYKNNLKIFTGKEVEKYKSKKFNKSKIEKNVYDFSNKKTIQQKKTLRIKSAVQRKIQKEKLQNFLFNTMNQKKFSIETEFNSMISNKKNSKILTTNATENSNFENFNSFNSNSNNNKKLMIKNISDLKKKGNKTNSLNKFGKKEEKLLKNILGEKYNKKNFNEISIMSKKIIEKNKRKFPSLTNNIHRKNNSNIFIDYINMDNFYLTSSNVTVNKNYSKNNNYNSIPQNVPINYMEKAPDLYIRLAQC